MLTSRGWWFLFLLLMVTALGVAMYAWSLVLVAFTVLAWFLGCWIDFALRLRLVCPHLHIKRTLSDERGVIKSLWADQPAEVRAELHTSGAWSLPYVWIVERAPPLADIRGDRRRRPKQQSRDAHIKDRMDRRTERLSAHGSVDRDAPLKLSYTIRCPGAGRLVFEGLVAYIADLQGFFQHAIFVREHHVYRVLPPLANYEGQMHTLKRQNVLPLAGTHRHPRPGSGSELLDLRDYFPGDPPKMIAWKASARRDKLMTKEFESEVPVRCTLFVDVSSSVRVGEVGRNTLSRLVEICAAVSQASAAVKDLTGLCIFDETGVRKLIRPARGTRHVMQMLHDLADYADLPLETTQLPLRQVLPIAFGLASEFYPDLVDQDVNAFPWWLPLWSPQPGYTQPLKQLEARQTWTKPFVWLANQLRYTAHLRSQFFAGRIYPSRRREYRFRKQLSAVLSVLHHMGPGGLAMLLEDDALCLQHAQRFLADHQVNLPSPLYDAYGRYQFASPEKLDVLARTLLQSVARGRDNELYVLLVDLLEAGPKLEEILRAVQLARARHHQVLVLCPWPAEIPLPVRQDAERRPMPRPAHTLQKLFYQSATLRLHHAARHVQRDFARLGVAVRFTSEDEAVSLILAQMNRLKIHERGRA